MNFNSLEEARKFCGFPKLLIWRDKLFLTTTKMLDSPTRKDGMIRTQKERTLPRPDTRSHDGDKQ